MDPYFNKFNYEDQIENLSYHLEKIQIDGASSDWTIVVDDSTFECYPDH